MSRVVVIGATGYIGTYLVPRSLSGRPEWDSVTRVTMDREVQEGEGAFGTQIAELRADVMVDLICFRAASATGARRGLR